MALTAAQIITKACKIAKCPAYTTDALDFLNMILEDLARTHNLEAARKSFTFTTAGISGINAVNGLPYWTVPADYLRTVKNGIVYLLYGVPVTLIQKELVDFDTLVVPVGFTDTPVYHAIDNSQSPPNIYVWPPPNNPYTFQVRYQSLPASITNTASVPWMPHQGFLIDKLSAALMRITDDTRQAAFDKSAAEQLSPFITEQEDLESTTKRVSLDRNRFRGVRQGLPNTKAAGF